MRLSTCILLVLMLDLGESQLTVVTNILGDLTGLTENPETYMTVPEIIEYNGYPVETHYVPTADGYILTVHRINKQSTKGPILVQHGFISSSADWVMNVGKQNLAFFFADAGYDVWLGNNRGNAYSLNNSKHGTDTDAFWDFNFDQMAAYDMPGMIDYILQKTSKSKLVVIGHSQGTTQTFAMLAQNTTYNSKVSVFFALAPVTTVEHLTSLIGNACPIIQHAFLAYLLLGKRSLLTNNYPFPINVLPPLTCDLTASAALCRSLIYLLVDGNDRGQINQTRMGVYINHTPAGTSVQTFSHLCQLKYTKTFPKYDYGSGTENKKRYGKATPPTYNLGAITAPIIIYWGENDKLANKTDVAYTASQLNSLVGSYRVPYDYFNHLDFHWGINATDFVFEGMLANLTAMGL